MIGLPAGWVWDLVEDGTITNNDALRLCGNGVVPQQAAFALSLAKEQDGDLAGALADYRGMLEKAPPDAAWKPALENRIKAGKPLPDGMQQFEPMASEVESWSDRFQAPEAAKPEAERNPHAAADAYLSLARGFDLARIQGLYSQESFYDARADAGRGAGTATVRFQLADTWWEIEIERGWSGTGVDNACGTSGSYIADLEDAAPRTVTVTRRP